MRTIQKKFEEITLIIPTHNRHGYLKRILEFYKDCPIRILIADSSDLIFSDNGKHVEYFHFQGKTFVQKLSEALSLVKTKFVVLCADDDFIDPDGIIHALEFLKENPGFASAQGTSISYNKRNDYSEYIEFNQLYTSEFMTDIAEDDPFHRLKQLFHRYRTIFSAVHYTENLRFAYHNVDNRIKNLFLNEYITTIIPVIAGKYREFSMFYQLRENADDSGDKTTDNLEKIYFLDQYQEEFSTYLNFMASKISVLTDQSVSLCKEFLDNELKNYADFIKSRNVSVKVSFTKKVGQFISKLPWGKKLVLSRRLNQQRKMVAKIVKTNKEKESFARMKNLIIKYGSIVRS